MGKNNKLLEKTRRKGEAKKWMVYVFAVVGILVIVGGFFGGLYLLDSIVKNYLENNKEIVSEYDFFDLKVGDNQTAVYFVGSSIVKHCIEPNEKNNLLTEKGYGNITAYNLGIGGFYDIEQSTQIQKIIDSSPALVIFGETYSMPTEYAEFKDENIIIIHDRLKVRDDALSLYPEDIRNIIENEPSIVENKRFLLKSIVNAFANKKRGNVSETTDLTTILNKNWRSEAENIPESSHVNRDNWNSWRPNVTTEMNLQKEAIMYNVRTIQNAGIPVIIINTPLHPITSTDLITNETRQNYFDFLNQTGAKWYDYEYALPEETNWFKDGLHIAPVTGAKAFAPMMADLIIQELT